MSSVVISSKYQVVIPRDVRERHGFRPGDRVSWFDGPAGLQLVRVRTRQELAGTLAKYADAPFEREKDHDFDETS